MKIMEIADKTVLDIIKIIKGIIAGEVACLIYPEGKKSPDVFRQEHAYIKFLPVVACIEFLGACYDEFPFETTRMDQGDLVEDRFNKALKDLFDKKYLPFSKKDNKFYFYKKLRCCLIHQLRPGKGIMLTTRMESIGDGTKHLGDDGRGNLILVLEDLYDDLQKAAFRIIRLFERKKMTNKKGEMAFIEIIEYKK